MGIYYDWVNPEKREYLCPNDFDLGNKRLESSEKGNALLSALQEMMMREWKGDRVMFIGDYSQFPMGDCPELIEIIRRQAIAEDYAIEQCPIMDYVHEKYIDIAAKFKNVDRVVHWELDGFLKFSAEGENPDNPYGFNLNDPYHGLFEREGINFQYAVNTDKKTAYDIGKIEVYWYGEKLGRCDPLPYLMSYDGWGSPGEWFGDVITFADQIPDDIRLFDAVYMEQDID